MHDWEKERSEQLTYLPFNFSLVAFLSVGAQRAGSTPRPRHSHQLCRISIKAFGSVVLEGFNPIMKDENLPNQSPRWPPQSYSSLAELLGSHDGMAIYRRFATLNAQNLLYLQSELIGLEDDLKRVALKDSNSEDEQRRRLKSDIAVLKAAPADAVAGAQ